MWMTKNPKTATPETDILKALQVMRKNGFRRLPVTRGKKLLGIVTREDLLRALPPDAQTKMLDGNATQKIGKSLQEIMRSDPVTVGPNVTIEEAALRMISNRIGALPVIEQEKLVGVITETDIFRALAEILGIRREGVRITFEMKHRTNDLYDITKTMSIYGVEVLSIGTLPEYSEDHRLVVVRCEGGDMDRFIDDLWKSRYRVIQVLRSGEEKGTA